MTTNDFVPVDLDGACWEKLEPLYQNLLDRAVGSPADLEQLLLDRSELDASANEAAAKLYIKMTCHTDDEVAKKGYLAFVEDVAPKLTKVSFEIDRRIVGCEHAKGLDSDRFRVMLRDLTADVELFRDENIPLQTEDTKLGQKFSEVAGATTIVFRDEELTLPMAAKHLEETDRGVREEVWRLIAERRFQDHETYSTIYDDMIALRDTRGRNAGFANFRDYMFKAKHRFDYTPADCEAYHRAAEEVCVPVMRKLNEQRAEALGVDSLRPWDLAVDVKGRDPLRPFGNSDELVSRTSELFHNLDGRLGEMFDTMRDGVSLDLETRKGKAPGGYQENLDRQRKPFIFMNAAGMHGDLETMIHEAGHAFHSMLCRDEPYVHYRHAPIEFAEVASMSMELLAHPYLHGFYDEEEVARAQRSHLEALSRLIPWTATIDAFQHWVYTHPNHTRDERKAYWLELDERFGSAVDWTGLEKYRDFGWQRQLHLFEVPFYYVEYGIAQLGALQLWLQSKKSETAAVANYMKALSLGGSRPLPELFQAADLTFDFGPDTVRELMDAVQVELDALPV